MHNDFRKVQRNKGSATLSLGRLIPNDWRIVRIEVLKEPEIDKDKFLILKLERVA